MPFDFPDAPVLDETVSTPDGTTYIWDGTKWTMAVVSSALTGWTVTEQDAAGTVPGAFTVTDTVGGVERFVMYPGAVAGATPVEILADGSINMPASSILFLNNSSMVPVNFPPGSPPKPATVDGDGGPLITVTTDPFGYQSVIFKLPDDYGYIRFRAFDSSVATETPTQQEVAINGYGAIYGTFLNLKGNVLAKDYDLIKASGGSVDFVVFSDNWSYTAAVPYPTAHGATFFISEEMSGQYNKVAIAIHHWNWVPGSWPTADTGGEIDYNSPQHRFNNAERSNVASYGAPYATIDPFGITVFGEPERDANGAAVPGLFHDANLRLTANTQSWDLIAATPDSGSAPGAFIIADATIGQRRIVIEPYIPNPALPPDAPQPQPLVIDRLGNLNLGNASITTGGEITAYSAYLGYGVYIDGSSIINAGGNTTALHSPYALSGDNNRIQIRNSNQMAGGPSGPDSAKTGTTAYRATRHMFGPKASSSNDWLPDEWGWLDETGFTLKSGNAKSTPVSPGVINPTFRLALYDWSPNDMVILQTWDVMGLGVRDATYPRAFAITDATADAATGGIRRLVIQPGAVAGTLPVEITAAGDLLVQGVPVGGGGMDEPVGAGSFGRTQNGTWDAVLSLLTGGEIAAGIDLRSGPLGQGLRLTQYGVYGDANTAPGGYGRNLNIYAGDGTYGGNVSLLGGKGTGNKGGNINLTGGQTDVMMGGDATLAGGAGGVNAQGGNAYLLGGDGMMAGYCRITGGDASRNNGVGGTVEMDGGKADTGLTAGGGVVWIRGGGAIAGNGGDINVRGGEGGASGGDLLFTGGRAMVTGGIPGNVRVQPGDNGVDGTLGLIFLENLPTTAPALEAALWNNAGVVSIVPSVAGDPLILDVMRAEIDRLSARLAALEGGGGGATPPATPAPRTPPPAPTAAPTAPARRPPPRR